MKLTRHTPTVVLALVGLGASIGAWRLARDYMRIHADAMHAATFSQTANTLFLAMEREMTSQLAVVHGLASFYASSERVDRDEFETFTRTSLQRHPALVALLWAVRTDPADVGALRARAHAVGVTMPLDVVEHGPDGQLRPARSRAAWYPVVLVEPAAARPAELGLDLAAAQGDRETLQRAVDTGLVLVTPPRQIKGEAALGFRSVAAVYKTGQRLDTAADRRDALDGFVAGVYRMDRLAHDALEPARRTTLHGGEVNLYIYSAEGDAERSPLLVQAGQDESPTPASLTLAQALDGLHQRHVVAIEDRSWLVIARPLNGAPPSVPQALSWITLLSGLALTGAAMAGSMMLTSRADSVETQVNARTAQLKAATQDLAERERRLRAIVDHTVNGIMTVDEHLRVLSANPAMERMFGYGHDEMLGQVATTLIT
ncbi:MAG: PAS domain S-box protein, partial [Oligoflexia bacterium]|nr:PAS domain S-box protein [Oligoflexia bacterium]